MNYEHPETHSGEDTEFLNRPWLDELFADLPTEPEEESKAAPDVQEPPVQKKAAQRPAPRTAKPTAEKKQTVKPAAEKPEAEPGTEPRKSDRSRKTHRMGARRKRRIAGFWIVLLLLIAGAAACYLLNGWKADETGSRYLRWGRPLTGRQALGDTEFSFAPTGYLKNGWFEENGCFYYQTREEGIFKGTRLIDGTYCSFTESGAFCSGIFEQGGVRYLRDENGFAPSGLVRFNGNIFLIGDNGTVLTGWQSWQEHTLYLDPETAHLTTGFLRMPDATYYFDESGHLITGLVELDGARYFFREDGKMAVGLTELEEGTFFFAETGEMQTGWVGEGDERRYFDEDGTMHTGVLTVGNTSFFMDHETGRIAAKLRLDNDDVYLLDEQAEIQRNCWADFGGERRYFGDDGKMLTGWQEIDGEKRYFDEDGAMAVSTSVDYYDIDENGNVTDPFTEATLENLDDYLHAILARNGSTIEDIFYYVHDNFSYRRKDQAEMDEMCVRFINTGTGACWDYAALTYRLLTEAGYNAQIISGWAIDGSRHMWTLVETEDGWRHVDPRYENFEILLFTDEEMLRDDILNYGWDRAKYPACR